MAQKIINDFLAYMSKNGGNWYDWYVGVAKDPIQRLFSDHNVIEHGGIWIYSQHTGSDTVARAVEQYFLNQGCDGGSGGGSNSSCFVYAYMKSRDTNEKN